MRGILIISHHMLAEAFVEASKMLIGEQEAVDWLGLAANEDPDAFRQQLCDKLDCFREKGFSSTIIMADLFGGTPFNQAVRLLQEYDVHLVAGLNLPMLLQTILSNSDEISAEELRDTALQNGRDGIVDAVEWISKMSE